MQVEKVPVIWYSCRSTILKTSFILLWDDLSVNFIRKKIYIYKMNEMIFFHWKITFSIRINLSSSKTNNKFDLKRSMGFTIKKTKNSAKPSSHRKPIGARGISLLTVRGFFITIVKRNALCQLCKKIAIPSIGDSHMHCK